MERGIAENSIQSTHDDGNPSSTLTKQVDINSELLRNPSAPGVGNTPPVVYDQAVTVPSVTSSSTKPASSCGDGDVPPVVSNQAEIVPSTTCSPEPPSSYGNGNVAMVVSNQAETVPSSGPNSADDPSIGVLPNTEDNGVGSVTPEPELTPVLPADASAWTMTSASPRSGPGYLIHDSILTEDVDWRNPDRTSLSSTPTQNMVHGDGYDPNRIPSSVFARQPTSSDWSTASNESLFSIYMGNSFSGYQGILMSEEQSKIDPFEGKANEGSDFSPNLPTLPETPPELETQQSENIKDDIRIQEELPKISTAMKEERNENHGNKTAPEENVADLTISSYGEGLDPFEKTNSIQNRLSNDSDRLSTGSNKSCSPKNRLSDESERSCGSFAFPVLVTDAGKSSSFRMRSDKKVEPPKKQQIEPPRTTTPAEVPQTTTQAAERGRCCLSFSFLPAWRCC